MTTKALYAFKSVAFWRCYVAFARLLLQCDGHLGTKKVTAVLYQESAEFNVIDNEKLQCLVNWLII